MTKRVDRSQFTFDGHGINGPDEYRSRLATLTKVGHALKVGPLLAAAPEMLEALEALLKTCTVHRWHVNSDEPDTIAAARAAIAKAKGEQL